MSTTEKVRAIELAEANEALMHPKVGNQLLPLFEGNAAELRRQHGEIAELRAQVEALKKVAEQVPWITGDWSKENGAVTFRGIDDNPAKHQMRMAFEAWWHDSKREPGANIYQLAWGAWQAANEPSLTQPAYKDSTPHLNVGNSSFESWYSTYDAARKGDKQRARDAYAAGMGDPLVQDATRPAVPDPITEEMHVAACKVLIRAHGLDGLPQRMLNAMLAAAPQPEAAQKGGA